MDSDTKIKKYERTKSKVNPRQTAILRRKLSDATGINMGDGIEEALSRMEREEIQ